MYRVILGVSVVALSGCLFGSTAATVAARRVEARASVARRAAIEGKAWATALAYDDVFLARSGAEDGALRAERGRHFAHWIEDEVGKLGPPRTDNLDAVFGTLVGFRREATRAAVPLWLREVGDGGQVPAAHRAEDPSVALRREDLGAVDAALIAPRLAALTPSMWRGVEAAERAGAWVAAVQRARAVVREQPSPGAQAAELAALEQRAAATFVDRARAAGDAVAGARVLHARLAAAVGGKPEVVAGLAALSPALQAEIGATWDVTATPASGGCGDLVDIDGVGTTLVDALRAEGWTAATSPDGPRLAVRFAGACPVVDHASDTTEEMPFVEIRTVTTQEPVYEERCLPNVYKEDTERHDDYIVTKKWVVPASCHDEITGSREVTHKIRVPGTERVTVHHLRRSIALAGTLAITVDGTTREWPFAVSGGSSDDPQYAGAHVEPRGRGNYTELEARRAAHDQLVAVLWQRRHEVFAARAAALLTRAKAAAAAGPPLEADHAFFVAQAMLTERGAAAYAPPPEMTAWMAATYHVPADALAAALAGAPLPELDLAAGHAAASLDLPIHLADYDQLNDDTGGRTIERQLSILLVGGPSRTTTASRSDGGALVSFAVNVNPGAELFGFRMTGGGLGAGGGHGFVDADFLGGYGLHTRGLWVGPLIGLGGDFTTGSQDETPTAAQFMVPPGAYVEYGARLAYTFPKNGKLELQYGKLFRTSSDLTSEKRAEGRFFYSGLGAPLVLSVRYVEYLPDVDGVLTAFSADGRLATSTWILGGVGF